MDNHQGVISENRSLTTEERNLLDWLMSHGTPQAQNYAAQIGELRVISRCSCGCPTIDFYPPTGPSEILADFYGATPEGVDVGVILHAREGRISEMGVYSVAKQDQAFGLPKIDTLKTFWLPSRKK
ncbi:MAG TPA: hypothetical protein VFE27_08865 [Acidobacteriaceae bacterium]|jgi:hypothetical protein|nr:hypothetical protein [Acidobacteriaceae bacterium]